MPPEPSTIHGRLNNDTWTTMFGWNGTNWDWLWSDYGSASCMIHPYKDKFIVGDFDGDGKSELMGCDLPFGWTTMFKWNASEWTWWWSDYYQGSQYIRTYRPYMHVGDFTGDGKDDIIGYDSWATLFSFNIANQSWDWLWSTNGASDFGGWNYPLDPLYDCALEGNYDDDQKEEVLLISRGPYAGWAMSKDFGWNPEPGWSFNWTANSEYTVPYIDDWPLNDGSDYNMARYYTMRERSMDNRDYLVALRESRCWAYGYFPYIASVYRSINGANKLLVPANGGSNNGNLMDVRKDLALNILNISQDGMLHFVLTQASDEVFGEIVDYQILDMTGRLVVDGIPVSLSEEVHGLDVSSLASGVYVLKLRLSGRICSKAFIKR